MPPPPRKPSQLPHVSSWRPLSDGVEVQRRDGCGYVVRSRDGHSPMWSQVAASAERAVRRLDRELKIWEDVGWILRSEGTDPETFVREAQQERDFFFDLRAWAVAMAPGVRPTS